MRVRVKVTNIVWDYDGTDDEADEDDEPTPRNLPTTFEFECDSEDLEDEGFVADHLSDEFGEYVQSLDFEVIEIE